jgi:sugar/nucleoside kinase (ribokinase family)
MREVIEELIEELSVERRIPKIVVMPHFCIDNLVEYGGDCESFIDDFQDVVKSGGGNIPIRKETLLRGGKAANCASALASIGADVHLITKTDELGYLMLEHFFKGKNVDLSHVRRNGKLGSTVAIEIDGANVMLSYPGSLAEFGPECITNDDETLIKSADVVCILDWGLNNRGTGLARYVFGITKEGGGKTFFDPGDPTFRKDEEIKEVLKEVIEVGLVDVLSVNEEEAIWYDVKSLRDVTRVDLHTTNYVLSEEVKIPTFDVRPKRFTGAGDAWDAGDIYGEEIGLSNEGRLILANSVAAFYISDPYGRHPKKSDLIDFLKKARFRRHSE